MTTISWTRKFFWIGVLIRFSNFSATSADAIEINNFVQMEKAATLKLQDYLIQERDRLSQLKTHLIDWKTWRDSNFGQESEYITIPQNLFHLFKISTLEWNELEIIISKTSSEKMKGLDEIKPPIQNHLKKIVSSLIDLQQEYDLKAKDITNGTPKGLRTNTSLHADLYFSVGKKCFDDNNHLCATDWLRTCLNSTSNAESRKKIIEMIYTSYIFLNQTEIAYEYAENSLYYNYYDFTNWNAAFDLGSQLQKLKSRFKHTTEANRICRGEHERPSNPNLKCRYNHDNSAFLKIAPLKEEQLFDAPNIFLYRDVLYDSEIEFIKNASVEYMQVALLSGTLKPTFSYRVTESAFLETTWPPLAALEKRADDIANFSIHFSEFWQVINYSPGGFYATHSDYLPSNENTVIKFGNRMTTMLFYMNDVTLGGETVFPYIGVSATPTKGSVLIWHNIHADGSRNVWTDHCACPVVIGKKWGVTKWVRSSNNRQCLRSIHEADLKIFEAM